MKTGEKAMSVLKLATAGFIGVFLLSGCSGKDVKIIGSSTKRDVSVAQVYGVNKPSMINNTNTRLLQVVAEDTLRSNNKFFSFNTPKELADAKISSADEFLAKCANKDIAAGFIPGAGLFISDDCNMFSGATGVGSAASVAGYTVHNNKPDGTALNADDVIASLKAKDLFKSGFSIENVK